MTPEIILQRWVTEQSHRHPAFYDYVGVLDTEKVSSPSFQSLLRIVKDAMNAALRLENTNASGGTEHPPYYFDYIEVRRNLRNAHAFQHEGFSFIAITLPLIELIFDLSQRLSGSMLIRERFGSKKAALPPDGLHLLLFQLQISFLTSHEYTHHVHRHVALDDNDGVWTEFAREETGGGIDRQAQEIDADAYAIYLVLANFLRGEGRRGALEQLGRQGLQSIEADALLLECFFLSLMALFCAMWPSSLNIASIDNFTHPPAPVRIEYAVRVVRLWSELNQSVPQSWFQAERFQGLFREAVVAIGGSASQQWDEHVQFLQSEQGSKYDRSLLERFEVLRTRKAFSAEPMVIG